MDRREISLDNETTTLAYLGRLNERDRRLYAAVEAHKLGYGGVSYIAGLLKISRASIYKGIAELKALAKSSDNDVDDDPTLPPRRSGLRTIRPTPRSGILSSTGFSRT